MSDERLGSWVVLRKLDNDLLGPTWRLGRAGAGGQVQELALGRGFSGADLAQEARSLGEVVDHPFVARTIEVFAAGTRAVVAWDYSSGHTLRQILARAHERFQPLGTGLALLVGERVAQGLAAAAERRVDGQPLVHGLLRPELIWVTNDGEIKVLGLELGAALGRQLSNTPTFAAFVAPEERSGAAIHELGSVYSLGATLYAAMTGEDPPSHEADQAARTATAAEDGADLAPELRDLLASCLGPRDQRPAGMAALSARLRELSLAAPRRVGPFELAYALHAIFGDEIAREAQEIEGGGRIEAPIAPAPIKPIASAGTTGRTIPEPEPHLSVPSSPPANPAGRRSPLLVPLIGAAVVAAAVVGWVLMPKAATDAPPPASQEAPAPIAAGPEPEELQERIRALVAQRTEDLAAGLREQQDTEIKALQEKLAAAQAAAVASAATPAPTPAPAVDAPTSPREGLAPPKTPEAGLEAADTRSVVAAPPPTKDAPAESSPTGSTTTTTSSAPAATVPAASTPAPVPSTTNTPTPRPAPATASPPSQAPAAVTPAPKPSATTAAPTNGAGDGISKTGPGVVPPMMTNFATPDYPLLARRTKVQGTVILSVLIDERGKAIDVKFLKRVEQDVGLNEAAEQAARASTWKPATKNGSPTKMWFTLPVPFALE